MKRKLQWKLVAILGLLTLSLTVQAWAHGFDRGGLGGALERIVYEGRPYGLRHSGRLVEQLVFPCRNDCVQAERTCAEMAESDALACATETCDAAIQTARTACAADRRAQACRDAVSALSTCIQPCVDEQVAAVASCLTTFRACQQACSPTPTPTP